MEAQVAPPLPVGQQRGRLVLRELTRCRTESCLQAVLLNPEHREALALMSEMYYEPWKHKWLRHAELANDEDILF